jgi:hypothetical protein
VLGVGVAGGVVAKARGQVDASAGDL